MSHRTRTTAVTMAAVAALAVGLAGPAASASPITDFINSIGTGSTAPGAGAQNTTEIRFEAGNSRDYRGYEVSRGSSNEDSCFTIQDRYSGQQVTTGYNVGQYTNNAWTVAVDTTKPGCAGPLQTTVSFSNSSGSNPAIVILFGRSLSAICTRQSASNRGCEQINRQPDGFDFRIR